MSAAVPAPEARVDETEHGKVPADDGWFILNLADIAWETLEGGGTWCMLESPRTPRNQRLGVGVHVLPPGETTGLYHREDDQEGFLVLQGACLVLVEGQERRLEQWDYFHCPPGTNHVLIGADGDEPCAIFMLGTRAPDHKVTYVADPLAARHGASVEQETDDWRVAYAGRPPIVPARSPWPDIVGRRS